MMRIGAALPILNSGICLLIIYLCISLFLTPGIGLYGARSKGESMLPTVPANAFLVLTDKEPAVGDIVHVTTEEYNIAHRLIALDGDIIITKGDNCKNMEVASLSDVKGVVIFFTHFGLILVLVLSVVCAEAVLAIIWARRVVLPSLQKHPCKPEGAFRPQPTNPDHR